MVAWVQQARKLDDAACYVVQVACQQGRHAAVADPIPVVLDSAEVTTHVS